MSDSAINRLIDACVKPVESKPDEAIVVCPSCLQTRPYGLIDEDPQDTTVLVCLCQTCVGNSNKPYRMTFINDESETIASILLEEE